MKEVPVLEVKRCFVTANALRPKRAKGAYKGGSYTQDLKERMQLAKAKVAKYSEKKLDSIIAKEYRRRLRAYNASHWYITTVSLSDVGVWRGAGKLPRPWTEGSVVETAQLIKKHMPTSAPLREFAKVVAPTQQDIYFLPIVFAHNTGTQGRRGLNRKLVGDIDDGCMRSIALALRGKKNMKVYFGVPKKKTKSKQA